MNEELQPLGSTHDGEVHGELSPRGGTPLWSRIVQDKPLTIKWKEEREWDPRVLQQGRHSSGWMLVLLKQCGRELLFRRFLYTLRGWRCSTVTLTGSGPEGMPRREMLESNIWKLNTKQKQKLEWREDHKAVPISSGVQAQMKCLLTSARVGADCGPCWVTSPGSLVPVVSSLWGWWMAVHEVSLAHMPALQWQGLTPGEAVTGLLGQRDSWSHHHTWAGFLDIFLDIDSLLLIGRGGRLRETSLFVSSMVFVSKLSGWAIVSLSKSKGYLSPRQLMTLYWAFILELLSPQKSIVFHYQVRLGH
ncbi:uncharacterized protein LOC135450903 isoform X2 [Zonotrichia leucophrys gambelii]